ncbi:cubilin-like [Amphiura filiformis]|uniref:cubilin-like n=1 Tax=Amphiura filiformis TaxID=82378 RepID=UPI003B20D1D0
MTVSGQDFTEEVECEGEVNDTRCHMECSSNCTCALDNVTITSNCMDGSIFVTQVLYPYDDVNSLSWAGSTLHSIKAMAFARFAESLEELDLSDNSLGELQPGVFEGLTCLEKLNLENNSLSEIQLGLAFSGAMFLKGKIKWCLIGFLLVALSPCKAYEDPPLPLCGGNVTSADSDIESPGYPHPYPGGIKCVWNFFLDEGTRAYLTFDDFEVDGPEDVVEVYDVYNETVTDFIGNFTGNKGRFIIISSGTKMQVTFVSSNTSSDNLQRRFHAILSTKGCGSTYSDSKSGDISAPIYNKQRMPAEEVMSCSWKINGDTKHKVALSFDDDDTNLGNRSYLEVRDGFNEKAPLLANFSGDYLLPDVISTQDDVFVKLTFQLGSPPKVQATFVEISLCSGRILLTPANSSIQIQSPLYPSPYPNNLDCRWLIESNPSGSTLVAIATSYTVEDINDVLVVHDGVSRSSNQLWAFNGRLKEKDIPWLVSSGQSLWIKFATDETGNQGYLSLNISMQESGGLVTNHTDAYFPSSVPMTVYQCLAPAGHQCVHLNVKYWNCTFNNAGARVSFYEGQRPDEDNLVHQYSAKYTAWKEEATPAFSNGRMMLVVAENLGYGGNCVGSEIVMLKANSFQHSYGTSGSRIQLFPVDTLYNGWVIHSDQLIGSLVQISILKLDLIDREWLSLTQMVGNMLQEEISIYEEWNGALTAYMTSSLPITIKYYDMPILEGRSVVYSISYMMLPDCMKHLNSTKPDYVTSPDYPGLYPLNALCTWEIKIDDNHLLHIIFEDMRIPDEHYLSFTSTSPSQDQQQQPTDMDMRFSGDVAPNDVIITSKELWVNFNSTAKFTYPDRGFKFFYEAIDCGGYLTASSGEFKSPGYPGNLSQDVTCMWILDLPSTGDKGKPNVAQLQFDYKLLNLQTES